MTIDKCPKCGRYAILMKGQDMCWNCYVKEGKFEPKVGEE